MATTLDTTINPDISAADAISARPRTFVQTIRNALVVTNREVRDSFRDWRIIAPIFVLTLVFPLLAQFMTRIFANFFESNGAAPLIDNFLPLLPMIVGFFPVSISLVIALETFVGEKERRSLEPLLATPLTNTELYLGKAFAAMLPPLLASYTGIAIYVGGLVLGAQHWRPEAELIVQIVLLTTAQALVMVTGAVVVSSQTTSTRASNLLASFIVIPISMLVMLESFIMVTNNRYILWYIIAGLVVADIMLFGMGARLFNREELLGRAIDEINLKWAWHVFKTQFTGNVKGFANWYRHEVLGVLPKMRGAMLIVALCLVGAVIGGALIPAARPDFRLPNVVGDAQLTENFRSWLPNSGATTVMAAFMQNTRVLLAGTILGTFTFGVMGVIISMAPFGILGFLYAQPIMAQIGLKTYLAAIIPHGLIEIPAIIIATAAALRLGAIITRPPQHKGIWDAWLGALADLFKVWIGLVIPLLIVAALVEVFITPQIVLLVGR
ncbi:MAG TPA: stage II sporulation protein M [Aggregatilineales bacterium]|nr:stage II sporulation protein M [Aggregatilineales bacterium]